MTRPLARLTPAPLRRALTLTALCSLGAALLTVALLADDGGLWGRTLVGAAGGAALGLARSFARATKRQILLMPQGIFDDTGTCLARRADISGVERSPFALKPSGGLLVRLERRYPRGWAPGLWWRSGRRLGLGGATSRIEGRLFAERLAVMLAEEPAHPGR